MRQFINQQTPEERADKETAAATHKISPNKGLENGDNVLRKGD